VYVGVIEGIGCMNVNETYKSDRVSFDSWVLQRGLGFC